MTLKDISDGVKDWTIPVLAIFGAIVAAIKVFFTPRLVTSKDLRQMEARLELEATEWNLKLNQLQMLLPRNETLKLHEAEMDRIMNTVSEIDRRVSSRISELEAWKGAMAVEIREKLKSLDLNLIATRDMLEIAKETASRDISRVETNLQITCGETNVRIAELNKNIIELFKKK